MYRGDVFQPLWRQTVMDHVFACSYDGGDLSGCRGVNIHPPDAADKVTPSTE